MMKQMPSTLACALLATVWTVAGCGPGSQDGDPSSAGTDQASEPAAQEAPSSQDPVRVALPGLFSLMAGLQDDMAGLDRGLWQEDFDTIAVRAGAVADHPTVPPEEAQAIAGVLGPEMDDFKQMDTNVHDLAVRIRELAGDENLEEILAVQAELHDGCVACHTRFRERIRAELP